MPLYELFCIASHNPASPVSPSLPRWLSLTYPELISSLQANLRQLIDSLARQVHTSGGVVRNLQNLGAGKTLPQRMRRNQQYHERGE
ncbi:hypothetical protein P7C73_g591, partial [Tremellales sp. Uapishka_1]